MATSYEEALKRFQQDVDMEEATESKKTFQKAVSDWAGFTNLVKSEKEEIGRLEREDDDVRISKSEGRIKVFEKGAEKLAKRFADMLGKPKPTPRRRREIARRVEVIVPTPLKRVRWTKSEEKVITTEKKKGRGYAQRVANRLGRTPKSVYMKSWKLSGGKG